MRFFVMTVLFVLLIVGGIFGTIWIVKRSTTPAPAPVIPAAVPTLQAPKPVQPTTKPAEKVLGPNEVRVLVASRPIPAYAAVRLEDVTAGGNLVWKDLDKSKIAPGAVPFEGTIDKFGAAIGRVAKKDIPANYPLMQHDFFDAKTRPGLVATIPAGYRAMIIDAARLPGVHNLRAGDHIDLVAAIPVDLKEVNRTMATAHSRFNYAGMGRDQMITPITPGPIAGAVPGAWTNPENVASPIREAEVRVLVDNGTLVMSARRGTPGAPLAPDRSGSMPIGGKQGTSGSLDGLTGPPAAPKGSSKEPPVVDEVMVVMKAAEVPYVTQALAIGAQIIVIPRSGFAETEEQAKTIPIKPKVVVKSEEGEKNIVEQVIGKDKSTVVFPGVKESNN